MAELFAKETGVSKGRGGSMHIFDVSHRFMGGYALVGGPFPLAAGIAKGIQMQGGDEICICFLGDAANNQGTFHESLNMAAALEPAGAVRVRKQPLRHRYPHRPLDRGG